MKHIRVLALAAAAVCLPTLVAGESALASHGSARKLEAWVESADVFASPSDSGWQCNMSFATGVIERGKHGVQRFKVRFRIYAGDTGYSPEWLNSWTESIYFDGAWSYGCISAKATPPSTGPAKICRISVTGSWTGLRPISAVQVLRMRRGKCPASRRLR